MKNVDFTLVQSGRRHPARQKDVEGETGKHTACPLGRRRPAGFALTFRPCDKARPRVGSPPPCNINSHLESSCGYEHETLKETAAVDPVPSHCLSHCLFKPLPYCSSEPERRRKKTKTHKLVLFPRETLTPAFGWLSVGGDVTNMWTSEETPSLCPKDSVGRLFNPAIKKIT